MTCGWEQPVKLTDEQRDMIVRTLNSYRKPKKLRDRDVQDAILRRIEGALTYLSALSDNRETNEPFDRVSDFSRSIHDTLKQVARLKEGERDNFELLGCEIEKLEDDMMKTANAALRVMSGLKIGQGEKYGTPEKARSQFLADQLGSLWRVHLELPTGQNSAFRDFLDVVCDQMGLETLGRDALDGVLNSAG